MRKLHALRNLIFVFIRYEITMTVTVKRIRKTIIRYAYIVFVYCTACNNTSRE